MSPIALIQAADATRRRVRGAGPDGPGDAAAPRPKPGTRAARSAGRPRADAALPAPDRYGAAPESGEPARA